MSSGIRKIFVGSLPNDVADATLRLEFSKYGLVEEVFIKPNCEPSRQWAFITFQTPEQAQFAKESCDRILMLPGATGPCDVMLAKNQGMFGKGSLDGAPPLNDGKGGSYGGQMALQDSNVRPKKIFVGSLPDGIQEQALRLEFSKYGMVEDIYLKANCEPGRLWAFVSFSHPDQAQSAMEASNGFLMFPGSVKPCEVTLARNQGMFGQGSITPGPDRGQLMGGGSFGGGCYGGGSYGGQLPMAQASHMLGWEERPRKIFVGSLPPSVTDGVLRAEFSKYGQVTDIFIKEGCEPNRMWAFVSFMTGEQASLAKDSCDRVLSFPGSVQPCEVTMAKHQGMFGKDSKEEAYGAPKGGYAQSGYAQPALAAPVAADGPRKVFVGSLPDSISDAALRVEFSKYGQVIDLFLKQGCATGRQWAFITFASHEQASYAKDSTDRVLAFPGSDRACEVMLAKNQGKFGQDCLAGAPDGGFTGYGGGGGGGGYGGGNYGGCGGYPAGPAAGAEVQPPPPQTPPPPHLTPWRMYKTASGLPYYHNASTGVTQWECPPELQVPGQTDPYAPPVQPAYNGAGAGQQRYVPY